MRYCRRRCQDGWFTRAKLATAASVYLCGYAMDTVAPIFARTLSWGDYFAQFAAAAIVSLVGGAMPFFAPCLALWLAKVAICALVNSCGVVAMPLLAPISAHATNFRAPRAVATRGTVVGAIATPSAPRWAREIRLVPRALCFSPLLGHAIAEIRLAVALLAVRALYFSPLLGHAIGETHHLLAALEQSLQLPRRSGRARASEADLCMS